MLLLLVWAAVLVTTALTVVTTKVGAVLPGGTVGNLAETLVRTGSNVVSLVVDVALIVVGFRLLTFRPLRTRRHLPGAVVAAVAWQVQQLTGTYLVGHELRGTSARSGCSASSSACCCGSTSSAVVLLLAAEVNTVRVLRLAPRSLWRVAQPNDPGAIRGDRRAFTAYARSQRQKTYQRIDVSFSPDAERRTRD